MSLPEIVHEKWVADRRVRILSAALAESIDESARILDVGCGNGSVSAAIRRMRPGIDVTGIDIQIQPAALLEVQPFDGERIPFDDRSFDVVMLIDVLHHTEEPARLLREAARVTAGAVLLKDHLLSGPLAAATLRFMDRVGNERHGVPLTFNYWREDQWRAAFESLGLRIESWRERLGIYPWPASLMFDRRLHFIAALSAGEPSEPGERGARSTDSA